MAWLESHQTLQRHPKTVKAVRLLGISTVQMVGHLHFLWWWAMDYAQSGSLTEYTNAEIAGAAGWEGEPGAFVHALTDAGFIDPDGSIHDWWDYAGKLMARKKSNAQRQREFRDRHKGPDEDVTHTVTGDNALRNAEIPPRNALRNRYVGVTVTERNSTTVPDTTEQETTEPNTTTIARADAGGAIIPIRQSDRPDRVWLARCYRNFVASYPKGVPSSVQDIWPEHCTSPGAFAHIMAGLEAWCKSRQWLADGNDWVTAPAKFLRERLYDDPPLPWKPDLPPDPTPYTPPPKIDSQEEARRLAREMAANGGLFGKPHPIDAQHRLTGG